MTKPRTLNRAKLSNASAVLLPAAPRMKPNSSG
ncbi:MAG TPA: hypothetical protein DEP50_02545 [Acinetobacter lwoffii]|nr:hypothetical protein [Acinetobacter lwoffii]